MNKIIISNDSFHDKEHVKTFYFQKQYKSFVVGSVFSTLVPMYTNLLKEVLGDKMNELFKDFELNRNQTQQIRDLFEKQLDETLPLKEDKKPYHKKLEWKGETYDLSLSLVCPNNRRIRDYDWIITICDECLNEDKPMYISIE